MKQLKRTRTMLTLKEFDRGISLDANVRLDINVFSGDDNPPISLRIDFEEQADMSAIVDMLDFYSISYKMGESDDGPTTVSIEDFPMVFAII